MDVPRHAVALLGRGQPFRLHRVLPQPPVGLGQLAARLLLAREQLRRDGCEGDRGQQTQSFAQPVTEGHAHVDERHGRHHHDDRGQRKEKHALADQHDEQKGGAHGPAGDAKDRVAEQQLDNHVQVRRPPPRPAPHPLEPHGGEQDEDRARHERDRRLASTDDVDDERQECPDGQGG